LVTCQKEAYRFKAVKSHRKPAMHISPLFITLPSISRGEYLLLLFLQRYIHLLITLMHKRSYEINLNWCKGFMWRVAHIDSCILQGAPANISAPNYLRFICGKFGP